jgi:uncharacterized protein (TIGR02246 family)
MLLAALALLLAVPAAMAQTHEEDVTAIQKLWQRYTAVGKAGDLQGWVDLWTRDGIRLMPGAPPAIGIDAVRASMEATMAQFDSDGEMNLQETVVAGDWAYSWGTYVMTMTPKAGGASMTIDGKFMTILQRQPDGSWKIHRDMFNSNVPPPS